MNTKRIADIILNMTLDMDFADMIDSYDEVVSDLQSEIDGLGKDSCLRNVLETIATENENLYGLAYAEEE